MSSISTEEAVFVINQIASIVSSIPIPGFQFVSVFVDLLTGWPTDPWEEYSKRINDMINSALGDKERTEISNELKAAERIFNNFTRELKQAKENNQFAGSIKIDLMTRCTSLVESLTRVQQLIYNPHMEVMHTLAYYNRYFLLMTVVLIESSHFENSIDEGMRLLQLYDDSSDYLNRVLKSMIKVRKEQIERKSGGVFNHLDYTYDKQWSRELTDWWPHSPTTQSWRFIYLQHRMAWEYLIKQAGELKESIKSLDKVQKTNSNTYKFNAEIQGLKRNIDWYWRSLITHADYKRNNYSTGIRVEHGYVNSYEITDTFNDKRIKNRLRDQYLHTENNSDIQLGDIQSSWISAHWTFYDIDGTDDKRIRNRFRGKYIHNENKLEKAEFGDIENHWESAKWIVEKVDNRYIRLKNRYTSRYLDAGTAGYAQLSATSENPQSIQWSLEDI